MKEIGAIFDSCVQIGSFFMDKKMFFKPDRRKEHGRKRGKTPEKRQVKCLFTDCLLRERMGVSTVLLQGLYLQRNFWAVILLRRRVGKVTINNIAVFNSFNNEAYMISQTACWHP